MLQIFKKQEPKASVEEANRIVDEIHEIFYTEVNRLLEEAKVSNSLHTDKEHLIAKANRLSALGFNIAKSVLEATGEKTRLYTLEAENQAKEALIEAIKYFSHKYPQYKFITEDSVKKICEKYGLVYGAVDRYMGDVPEKNLKEIESFKADEEDELYLHMKQYLGWPGKPDISYANKGKGEEEITNTSNYRITVKKAPFEIAAPVKDFAMEGWEVKNSKISKIEAPDPVVLAPVLYKENKYFLVVSAWGQEASDELVVNERLN